MRSNSTQIMTASSKRRAWLLSLAALGAGLAGAGVAFWRHRLTEPEDSALTALWAFEAELPGGGTFRLNPLRGKPVVLNFWATWCPPCVEEMPLLEAFARQHAANGWQVVGIAADQARPVMQFVAHHKISFPTPLAGLAGIELSRTLGNLSGGLPFTVVLSSNGQIALRHSGKLSAEQIANFIKLA